MTSLHSPPASPPRQRAPSPSTHPNIPYNAAFTTSLSALVLRPGTVDPPQRSICIVTSSTPSQPPPSASTSTSTSTNTSKPKSVPLRSIDFTSLPSIPQSELPLPLDDPRRKYESALPGVLLTHPGGHLEGGIGDGMVQSARGLRVVLPTSEAALGTSDSTLTLRTLPISTPTVDSSSSSVSYSTYLSLILASIPPDPSALSLTSPTINAPTTSPISATTTSTSTTTAAPRKSAFQSAITAEIAVQRAELEKRLKARERVVRRNEELKRKVGDLEVQRSVERRVEEGWRKKRRGVVG